MHAVIITPAQIPRRTMLAMLPMSSSLSFQLFLDQNSRRHRERAKGLPRGFRTQRVMARTNAGLLADRARDESLSTARTIGGVRARTPDPSRASLRRSDFKAPSGTEALRLTERFRRRPTIGRTICCRRAELAA